MYQRSRHDTRPAGPRPAEGCDAVNKFVYMPVCMWPWPCLQGGMYTMSVVLADTTTAYVVGVRRELEEREKKRVHSH